MILSCTRSMIHTLIEGGPVERRGGGGFGHNFEILGPLFAAYAHNFKMLNICKRTGSQAGASPGFRLG